MTQETQTAAEEDRVAGPLDARMDGVTVRGWILIGLGIGAVVLGFGAWWTYGLDQGPEMGSGMGSATDGSGMAGMAPADAPTVPPVTGLYAGEEVLFLHTEASDPEVAGMLTEMMGSPVVVVPQLADAPESTLGRVYAFTNGLRPEGPAGPFGFQPDVFDSAPGDGGYSPLREVQLVTWGDGVEPRLLTSAAEVVDAQAQGELDVESSGIVVNMPFLRWPGGAR
jgi:hypothetical protein